MDRERVLIELIQDFREEALLESAKHCLLVVKKNIVNINKELELRIHEIKDTKRQVTTYLNKLSSTEDDLRSIQHLKCNLESKIADFIASVDISQELPVTYDPELELVIDQKVELYTNYVAYYRALEEKKARFVTLMQRLQTIIKNHNKELAKHHQMLLKYKNWIPELRNKQAQTSAEVNAIEHDIVEYHNGYNNLSTDRFELMQNALQNRMQTLMQLNGFSHRIRTEYGKRIDAIAELNGKKDSLQIEMNNTHAMLKENDKELESVKIKYSKLEEQIHTYVKIQENFNIVNKCRAYYELTTTYEQEKEDAQNILNIFEGKLLNETYQISAMQTNVASWLDEKSRMEDVITLIYASM